ncbi:MAG TPA: hypothetical protein VMV19_17660, partial [Xanthobacteraceae bacterium]|nr:hypothetical protein [Xanthobacteraceae bacterium]
MRTSHFVIAAAWLSALLSLGSVPAMTQSGPGPVPGIPQLFTSYPLTPSFLISGATLSLNYNASLTLDGANNLGINLANPNTWMGTQTFPSPVFTGVPVAPTATFGTDTTQLATTAFVQTTLATGNYAAGPSTT